jgi:hypothetical protein
MSKDTAPQTAYPNHPTRFGPFPNPVDLLLLVSELEARLRTAYSAAGKTDGEMEEEHPVLADARRVLDMHWRR